MSLAAEEVAEPREVFRTADLFAQSIQAADARRISQQGVHSCRQAIRRRSGGSFRRSSEKDDVRVFVLFVHKTAESAATLERMQEPIWRSSPQQVSSCPRKRPTRFIVSHRKFAAVGDRRDAEDRAAGSEKAAVVQFADLRKP